MIDFYKCAQKLSELEEENKALKAENASLKAEFDELKKENAALKLLLEWAEETGFGYDQIPEEYAEFKDDLERLDIGYMEGFIYMAKKRVEQGCKGRL